MGLLDGVRSAVSSVVNKVEQKVEAAVEKVESKAAEVGHVAQSTFEQVKTKAETLTGGSTGTPVKSDQPVLRGADLRNGIFGDAWKWITGGDKKTEEPKAPAPAQVDPKADLLKRENEALSQADALMKAGKYDEARALLAPLKTSPSAGEDSYPWAKYKNTSVHSEPGSAKETIFKNPEDLKEKGLDTVNRKLAQIDQAQRMSTALGRTVDPTNVGDAKAYFDKISDKKAKPQLTTPQVREEFANYVGNFYQHTGGLAWDPKDPVGNRVKPDTLNEMLHGSPPHPRDTTGRAALDCEGTTYLTAAIFQNNPRFDVSFVQGGSHISATVFEKGSAEKGFNVNTVHKPIVQDLIVENGDLLKKQFKNVEERQNAVAGGRHGEEIPGKPNQYFGNFKGNRDIVKVNAAPVE